MNKALEVKIMKVTIEIYGGTLVDMELKLTEFLSRYRKIVSAPHTAKEIVRITGRLGPIKMARMIADTIYSA